MRLKKLLVSLGDSSYYNALRYDLVGMNSVLDVGCGARSPISKVPKKFHSVGFDVFAPSIKASKKAKIHDEYKLGDISKLSMIFKKKSFDAVIALDVIEHLEYKDGIKFLHNLEKIAKKKVIILTPFGFTHQHPYEDNPFQIHKSGWTARDFKKLGYKVHGMRGLRFIRGECATIKYKPWLFWGTLASLSQYIIRYFPQYAYQIFAVKDIKK